MSATLAVINRLGKAIDGPAGDLEAAAERVAGRVGAAVGALRAFLQWAADTPRGEWPEGAAEVLDQVVTACSQPQNFTAEFQEVIALINMFGSSSRHLRRPARRIARSFQTLFRSVTALEEWRSTAVEIRQG
ncbi:hypothetical protein [Streptomyces phaeolivaceus]|uniref:hypothetical protein n=1 Tax=Streptomyces phaeolivaceus TaxID=2653200 RepID=UPI00186A3EE2|nr:hypothetical protein [Streptomyces phaeolivaceus]